MSSMALETSFKGGLSNGLETQHLVITLFKLIGHNEGSNTGLNGGIESIFIRLTISENINTINAYTWGVNCYITK